MIQLEGEKSRSRSPIIGHSSLESALTMDPDLNSECITQHQSTTKPTILVRQQHPPVLTRLTSNPFELNNNNNSPQTVQLPPPSLHQLEAYEVISLKSFERRRSIYELGANYSSASHDATQSLQRENRNFTQANEATQQQEQEVEGETISSEDEAHSIALTSAPTSSSSSESSLTSLGASSIAALSMTTHQLNDKKKWTNEEKQHQEATGFEIVWLNFTYSVEPNIFEDPRWGKINSLFHKERRTILKGISGGLKSGQMVALMGPSGAGKTCLLESIAGIRLNGIGGELRLRGRKRVQLVTVPQYDDFMPQFTVEEIIVFGSKMKNPSQTNHLKVADKVIQQLGLQGCRRVNIQRCSGGQRKRVAIAQELVSRPNILILDEPTSGLDSSCCYQTMRVLRDVIDESVGGEQPMAIVTTIHQPSAKVFKMFDSVYLLGKTGFTAYSGPPAELLPTIRSVTGLECPQYSNPSDFMIELVSYDYGAEAVERLIEFEKEKAREFVRDFETRIGRRRQSSAGAAMAMSLKGGTDGDSSAVSTAKTGATNETTTTTTLQPIGKDLMTATGQPTSQSSVGAAQIELSTVEMKQQLASTFNSTRKLKPSKSDTQLVKLAEARAQLQQNKNKVSGKHHSSQDAAALTGGSTSPATSSSSHGGTTVDHQNATRVTGLSSRVNYQLIKQQIIARRRQRGELELYEHLRYKQNVAVPLRKATSSSNVTHPFFWHTFVHIHRSFLQSIRDPILNNMRILIHIGFAVLLVLLYGKKSGEARGCPPILGLPTEITDPNNDNMIDLADNVGYLFMTIMMITYVSLMSTVLTFPIDIKTVGKEYKNGWYGTLSYFIGRTVADLPFIILYPVAYCLINWYSTNQAQEQLWRFFSFTGLIIMNAMNSQSFGLILGALFVNSVTAATFLGPVITIPWYLFTGFTKRVHRLAEPYRTTSRFLFTRYVFEGLLDTVYGHERCNCSSFLQSYYELREEEAMRLGQLISAETLSSLDYYDGLDIVTADLKNSTALINSDGSLSNSKWFQNTVDAASNVLSEDLNLASLTEMNVKANSLFSFGLDFEPTCPANYRNYVIQDFRLNDKTVQNAFTYSLIILILGRILTFIIVSWKIRTRQL